MDIYSKKRRWKWILFAFGVLIVSASLFYTNLLVKSIAGDEREKVKIWVEAIQRKALLVNYTEEFFESVEAEERKRVEIWAKAYRYLSISDIDADVTFLVDIIAGNKTIPVILADENRRIITTANTTFGSDTVKVLEGDLLEEFTLFPPIYISRGQIIYYKESNLFTGLRAVLNDIIESFISEVVNNASSVPVIVTDSTRTQIVAFGNLDTVLMQNRLYVQEMIREMESGNAPLEISLPNRGTSLIFYKESFLLRQLKYYPIVQFFIIGVFLLISYILFSIARNSEQNRVWVGMAKETAHQLGTPISSMMAWIDLIRSESGEGMAVAELSKDVHRLEQIAERFSKIGSPPVLEPVDMMAVLNESLDYLSPRISKQVEVSLSNTAAHTQLPLNPQLFGWVVENLIRNSVDAMGGKGELAIVLSDNRKELFVDISDTGKGIPRKHFKSIFTPGFTTKKRGWGLGLTLAKRIITNYHRGKIFVKTSALNQGTTIRIVLRKGRNE